MYRDLDEIDISIHDSLLSQVLVQGFEASPNELGVGGNLDESFPDPRHLGHIMDADASQTRIIEAARKGNNLVVQGPPGTGKSQTIANIIAAAAKDGKRILFVAEKRAALDDVYPQIPLVHRELDSAAMLERARTFLAQMRARRSVREFSDRPVSRELIEYAIATAGSAPSCEHREPWHFVAVSSRELKAKIREAAEVEEKESYMRRMPAAWLKAIVPLGTDWRKPFLEIVPWVVVCFAKNTGDDGLKNYYVQESCGIACGLFIAAVHNMGLVTLTHTPSPMGFLQQILNRPRNERAYMLFPVGYPA